LNGNFLRKSETNYLRMCVFVLKNKYRHIINNYFPTKKKILFAILLHRWTSHRINTLVEYVSGISLDCRNRKTAFSEAAEWCL